MAVDFITNLILSPFVLVSAIFLLVAYKLIFQHWNFFDKIGIKYVRGLPILGTHYKIIIRLKSSFDSFHELYKKYSDEQVIGIYDLGGSPMYVINDIEITKKITSKDFDHFVNHRAHIEKNIDSILGRSLLIARNQDWKDLRSTISPAFTGSKMKQMMVLINECTSDLVENINSEISKNNNMFDMKDLFQRNISNTVASAAFGFKVNSFKDKDNQFYERGSSAGDFGGIRGLKMLAFQSIPKIMKFFKITVLSQEDTEYFRNMIRENMKYREENNIYRPDMINLMMEARKGSLLHDTKNEDIGFATVQESDYGKGSTKHLKLDEDDLVSHCMIFVFGGFSAVPTAQCFLAHEIAVNEDVQERLYDEIKTVNDQLSGKPLTYDVLRTMKYMDMVVSELLRRWTIAPFSDRAVNKPYNIQLKNGKTINLKVGDGLWLPIVGYHLNEKYFPNPLKFDPERFSDENKKNIIPGTYLPFSIGPRNCVGSRFALMEMKLSIYYLLLNFKLEMCEKTTHPIKLKPCPLLVADFWLQLKPRLQ